MKLLRNAIFCCLGLISSHSACAASFYPCQQPIENIEAHCFAHFNYCDSNTHFANPGFSVTDTSQWYDITTLSYPVTTPLSLNRNKGVSEGRVYLSPSGVTIGEAGNYWVSITAILYNSAPETALIPVFLVRDEQFNFNDPSLIGGVVTLPTDIVSTVNATGILHNVPEGTRLSLVATNGGNPLPQPIKVVSWNISLFKMP